jgi:hypothetical protein
MTELPLDGTASDLLYYMIRQDEDKMTKRGEDTVIFVHLNLTFLEDDDYV